MKRWLVLAAIALGVVIASKLLLEDVLGLDLQQAAAVFIVKPGAVSALVVMGLLALDILVPVPSSLVMVLSGAVFGAVQGALLSLVGSVAGSWMGFELARKYGRSASVRFVGEPTLRELEHVFARHDVMAVVVTRALPIAMEATSIVAGLSRMGRARFLGATVVGTAPVAAVYGYAGALSRETGSVVPAVVMVVVLGVAWIVYRRPVPPIDRP